jgi:guanylate kinase
MGTPIPDPPPGADVLLEIDVQGAEQVLVQRPDATVIMLLPPSSDVQAARLAARGDDAAHIRRRVDLGQSEVERGARIAHHTVVNEDLHQALAEVRAIVEHTRSVADRAASASPNPDPEES